MLLSCRNNHHTDKRRKLPERTLRRLKRPWTAQSLTAQKPSTQDEPLLSTTDTVSVKRSSSGFPKHCSSHCESRRVFPSEERLSHRLTGVSTGAPPDALARRGLLSPRQTLGGYTVTARVPGCWAASPGSLVALGCAQRPPACMGTSGQGGRGRRGGESSVLTTEDAPPAVGVGGPAGLTRGARRPGPGRVLGEDNGERRDHMEAGFKNPQAGPAGGQPWVLPRGHPRQRGNGPRAGKGAPPAIVPNTSLWPPGSPGRLQRRGRGQHEGHQAAGDLRTQALTRFLALRLHRLHGLTQPGSRAGGHISETPARALPSLGVGRGVCAHGPLVRPPNNRFSQIKSKHSHRTVVPSSFKA